VRQNLKEVSWLMIGLMFSAGLVIGLLLGYWPMRSSQNNMQDRIEQYPAAQQPPTPASAAPDVHAQLTREKQSRHESMSRSQGRLWICRSSSLERA
jgi:hypothetical protein